MAGVLAALTARYREEPPHVGHALQAVAAPVLEDESGAGDEVAHGARDQDLARAGQGRHARADVDGDATNRSAATNFDLAGVHTCTDLEPEPAHRAADGEGAAHRPRGPVEDRQQAVAGLIHLTPAMPLELSTGHAIELVEKVLPA